MKTKLTYSIWRKVGRKQESKNGTIVVEGNYDDDGFTHTATQAILAENPGWMIAGFSSEKVKEWREDE